MEFGSRRFEQDEPVLYFEHISIAALKEGSQTKMARGGYNNAPRVIWSDRTEAQFQMIEGVMSAISMSVLLSANVTSNSKAKPLIVPLREGPNDLTQLTINNQEVHGMYIKYIPVGYPERKTFIFEYDRDVAQKKVYGKLIERDDPLDGNSKLHFLAIYEDRELTIPADIEKQYVVDYYYEYGDEALIYTIQQQRFNGLFTLEGKFYAKDENDGLNYTNLIYMPKVRVVSDINLRLGERADPAVSTFNIIGLPENVGNDENNLIVRITRLGTDVDGNI